LSLHPFDDFGHLQRSALALICFLAWSIPPNLVVFLFAFRRGREAFPCEWPLHLVHRNNAWYGPSLFDQVVIRQKQLFDSLHNAGKTPIDTYR
jgi:hypothetical protein